MELEQDINYLIEPKLKRESWPVPSKDKVVAVLDRDIMDFDDEKLFAQNPYVLTVVEVMPESDGRYFWQYSLTDYEEKDDEGRLQLMNQEREAAAILLRMLFPKDISLKELNENISRTRIPYDLRDIDGDLKNYAWYRDNSGKKKYYEVGLKKPNAFGLFEMHVNVWELCSDFYEKYPNNHRKKI